MKARVGLKGLANVFEGSVISEHYIFFFSCHNCHRENAYLNQAAKQHI